METLLKELASDIVIAEPIIQQMSHVTLEMATHATPRFLNSGVNTLLISACPLLFQQR